MNGELLWKPSEERIRKTNMYTFMEAVNRKHGTNFKEYSELYNWSIRNIPEFWANMWDQAGIIASKMYDTVIDDITKMPGAKWFSGSRLTYAQNLLRFRDDKMAIIFKGEAMDEPEQITYAQLFEKV